MCPVVFRLARHWALPVALCFSVQPAGVAADAARPAAPAPFDFSEPRLLTGTLFEIGSGQKKILFTFRRTASRTNDTVSVERKFLCPDGSVAAAENITYASGQLVSFQMREFQSGVSGGILVEPDPKKPARQKLFISYTRGLDPPKGDAQNLPADTVIADSLYPYMLAHWDDLMRGVSVKFRFVSMEKETTYMFRLVKAGETQRDGHALVQLEMEPTNLLVSQFVDPLVFTVEKGGQHRVLSYIGRTTPRVKKGKAWKYLDAETVFDWN